MTASAVKNSKVRNPLMRFADAIWAKREYLITFFAPVLILFAAYMAFGVYPAGDESVLVLDLNGQYVYYYENLRDVFWGNGSPFISWSRNLTGEIVGIFAYYLASPFVLIVMLLPRSIITESLLIMQLCKIGTSAVAFRYYLIHSRGIRKTSSIFFGAAYSLMAYAIVQLMNPMWLDGLIYLPFIILGIERLIEGRSKLWFIVPLTLMYMAHFYIGWMITFFSILYFFYYYFAGRKETGFRFSHFVKKGCAFAISGVTSALCSAWILIPLYYSLKLGKFEFTSPKYEWKTNFDFLDFFRNLLPNLYDTCRPEGSPAVYCGVLTLILVPLYFLNNNITLRNKIGSALLSLSLILSMYISNIDIAWHGMQNPNWLPYRYSFTLSFVILAMAAQSFDNINGISFKEIGGTMFGLLFYIFYIDKQGLENADVVKAIWYSAILVSVYSLILYLYKKNQLRRSVYVALSIFLVAEGFISTWYNIEAIDTDVNYSKHSSYNKYIELGRKTVSQIYEQDDGVYRIESDHHRTVNDAMAFGSYGVSHSSSTLNAKPIQFLRKLGFSYGGHYIKYSGATYITDSIFGIKYVMEKGSVEDEEPPVSKHYDNLVLSTSNNKDTFYVYENPYALPIAFMVDTAAKECSLQSWDYPFENQNLILSSMLGKVKKNYFRRMNIDEIVPENAKPSVYGSHSRYTTITNGENSQVEFLLTAPNENMIYLYLPTSYERQVNMWLNKDFLAYYFEGGKMVIQTLGRFSTGDPISLIATIANEKNEVLFKDEQFFYLNEELFRKDIVELAKHPLEIEEFSEDHIKGTITADEDGIMYTSITNEPGWKVYVDGAETEIVELYEALIGVELTAGTHTIEMKFRPNGMGVGILATVGGIFVMLVIIVLEVHTNRKIQKQAQAASESISEKFSEVLGENASASEDDTDEADDNDEVKI